MGLWAGQYSSVVEHFPSTHEIVGPRATEKQKPDCHPGRGFQTGSYSCSRGLNLSGQTSCSGRAAEPNHLYFHAHTHPGVGADS